MENASAKRMWQNYLKDHLEHVLEQAPKTCYFGTDETNANNFAKMAKNETKKTITHSLLGLQNKNESLPKIGNFIVVTDWKGEAQCIVRTTKVSLKPYFSIDAAYTQKEGVEDKSLESWKQYYWNLFINELQKFKREPKESMIVVCQEFEKVYD